MKKKIYTSPSLVTYGMIHDLTRGGVVKNSDQPKGIGPDAYPPAS